MQKYKQLLVAAALAATLSLWAATAMAQSDGPTWYNVEVIIFEQQEPSGGETERWDAWAPPPQGDGPIEHLRSIGTPSAYAQRPASVRKLNGAYQRLERKSGFTPLMHLAWRQPGLPRNRAPAVAVPRGWTPPADAGSAPDASDNYQQVVTDDPLYGLIKVYRERYLHVNLDLRYQPMIPDADRRYPYLNGASPVFVLKQSRRVRSGELHYLDHPVLGALVLITKVESSDSN